jgi:hypothetical protein
MKKRFYIGYRTDGNILVRELFSSASTPIASQHPQYNVSVGPFRTKLGAIVMIRYGYNNPHLQCVRDAERMANVFKTNNDPLLREGVVKSALGRRGTYKTTIQPII